MESLLLKKKCSKVWTKRCAWLFEQGRCGATGACLTLFSFQTRCQLHVAMRLCRVLMRVPACFSLSRTNDGVPHRGQNEFTLDWLWKSACVNYKMYNVSRCSIPGSTRLFPLEEKAIMSLCHMICLSVKGNSVISVGPTLGRSCRFIFWKLKAPQASQARKGSGQISTESTVHHMYPYTK